MMNYYYHYHYYIRPCATDRCLEMENEYLFMVNDTYKHCALSAKTELTELLLFSSRSSSAAHTHPPFKGCTVHAGGQSRVKLLGGSNFQAPLPCPLSHSPLRLTSKLPRKLNFTNRFRYSMYILRVTYM